MSNNVNKVILLGNVSKNIELNKTKSQVSVCSFSLATHESWKNRDTGEPEQSTEWHQIVVWGKLAEIVSKAVRKGSLIYLEGKNKTRKWVDENNIERVVTEVIAEDIKFLDAKAS